MDMESAAAVVGHMSTVFGLLQELPPELRLLVAGALSHHCDRINLCLALPPLGLAALRELESYQPLVRVPWSLRQQVADGAAIDRLKGLPWLRELKIENQYDYVPAIGKFYSAMYGKKWWQKRVGGKAASLRLVKPARTLCRNAECEYLQCPRYPRSTHELCGSSTQSHYCLIARNCHCPRCNHHCCYLRRYS